MSISSSFDHFLERIVTPFVLKRYDENPKIKLMHQDIDRIRVLTEELSRRESELRESENLLQEVINNTPEMIWAKDLDGNFILANKATKEKLLQLGEDEHLPIKPLEWFAENQIQKGNQFDFGKYCKKSDNIVLETGETRRFLEDGYVNGKYLALMVYKAPRYNSNNKMVGLVGSAHDVTDFVTMLDKAIELIPEDKTNSENEYAYKCKEVLFDLKDHLDRYSLKKEKDKGQ